MAFNQAEYVKKYQKDTYKMYAFRVRKDNKKLIKKLNSLKNKNEFIVKALMNEDKKDILTIAKIKKIIKPILNKWDINDIYLFGSYARGEANKDSDVDIYCERGNVKSLYDVVDVNEELKKALNKKVDLIFDTIDLEETFKKNIERDLIKLI